MKLIPTMLLCVLLAGPAVPSPHSAAAEGDRHAQPSPERGPPPPPPLYLLAEALALDDAQLAPVRAVLTAQNEALRVLADNDRAAREALHKSTRAQLMALLDAEQRERLEIFERAHRPPPPPHREHAPPPRAETNRPSR